MQGNSNKGGGGWAAMFPMMTMDQYWTFGELCRLNDFESVGRRSAVVANGQMNIANTGLAGAIEVRGGTVNADDGFYSKTLKFTKGRGRIGRAARVESWGESEELRQGSRWNMLSRRKSQRIGGWFGSSY